MRARSKSLHGAAVTAPSEDFPLGESPPPARTEARRAVSGKSPPPAGPSFGERLLGGVKLVAGLAVVVAASTAVAYSLHRYALTTTRFGIQKVELEGAKRFSPDQVRTLAGIELGRNLFAFDTRAAEDKLLHDPWVSSAHVVRKLPGTLRVELGEREASAIAVIGDKPFLLTADGEPFKEVKAEDPADLPLVTGISAADWARDRAGAMERFRTGVDLIRQYERLPMAKVHPAQEVSLAASGDAVLTVGRQGIALELGRPPFARKLAMAGEVVGELGGKGRTPGIVFLDNEAHPERVVVRMR
ncbi:MAG TPA: FtsQ-type POTRA domain-containing protein [Polyangiaceae bacterium]|jgi:cell division protein FtsQ|nr:FtsQ-type POTRA domain-containing protein [Polyangiaceae bacterium]